ncbi:hypothetical protein [Xanthovirga aplysinae]|uniref:hypothetical protein n=1 Tax=Xanthovirga aplysinae TaxID=2529853 RepID=UPI0012BC991F|nr:hypothetical protein [Xanthovirga aplysinae]MTI33298.1 hypothetical protein [Xanthovirga aplysinae]
MEYLKNKRNNINALRNISFALVAGLIISNGVAFVTIAKLKDQIYIIGKSFSGQATATEGKSNPYRVFEVENHIASFTRLFFSFDQFTYDQNEEAALQLIGSQGKELRKQRIAEKYRDKLKQTNVTCVAFLDSIKTDMKSYPYRVRAYGTQIFSDSKGRSVKKQLRLSCTVSETGRGRENPFGLLIDNLDVKIKDLKRR